ncbi:MAG: TPM domain-containing protein [Phycisphaerae bacterium]|nr:TPM domain-containing protein [Phycisphaerae bacterium]
MKQNSTRWMLVLLLIGGGMVPSRAVEEKKQEGKDQPLEKITRPQAGTFIADVPNIIDPINEGEINAVLSSLQEEHGVTLYVVVISSLAKAGYENAEMEDVGKELMETWKLSPETLDGKPWDRGVLILFSREDNQIRVETGKGWKEDLDKPCRDVLHRHMLPYFSKEKYAVGLTKGIRSLDAAIRMQTPMRRIPPKLQTPKDDEFVVDSVRFFNLEAGVAFNDACRAMYQNQNVPMFIVTVKSLESISRKGLDFDTIAKRFFRFWPVTPESRRVAFEKQGVLLLLSRDDNLVGLEFADGWGSSNARGKLRQNVMTRQIVPALQANQIQQGILQGIQAVQNAAGEKKFPKVQVPAASSTSGEAKTNPAAADATEPAQ